LHEAFYDSNQGSYTGATVADLEKLGFRPSEGVTLTIQDATDQHYKLEACSEGGIAKSWVFDSRTARMTPVMP
jgi:hypothetical protein